MVSALRSLDELEHDRASVTSADERLVDVHDADRLPHRADVRHSLIAFRNGRVVVEDEDRGSEAQNGLWLSVRG